MNNVEESYREKTPRESSLIEACLHSHDKRITIAIRERGAFTYEIETSKAELISEVIEQATDVKIVQ